MNPVRPATYKVVRYILAHPDEALVQREIQRETGVSLGQVNKVVNWLVSRGYLKKFKDNGRLRGVKVPSNSVELVNPGGLITLFGLYRRMEDLLLGSFKVRAEVEQARNYLAEQGAVFCLDTALDKYSSYFRNPGLFCYVPQAKLEAITKDLKSSVGGALPLELYHDDMANEGDIEGHYTKRIRTVIDLTCANRFYTTRTLLKDLWGLEVG